MAPRRPPGCRWFINPLDIWVSTTGSNTAAGTQAAPVATITRASELVQPGGSVRVLPGTYNGTISTSKSGTAAARIKFVSDTPYAALLRFNAQNAYCWENSGSYVDVQWFDIAGTGSGGFFNWGSHFTITDNIIHDIGQPTYTSDGGGAIVLHEFNNPVNTVAARNLIYNIANSGGTTSRQYYQGIYAQHDTSEIVNNVVYACGGGGIHLWHKPVRVLIAHNIVAGCGDGIVVGAGDSTPATPADFISVLNNIAVGNTGIGIDSEGLLGENNIYAYNHSSGNGTDWRLSGGETHTDDIVAVPTFVNAAARDYRPAPGSSAIGSALPGIVWDTHDRYARVGWDIGPYRYEE